VIVSHDRDFLDKIVNIIIEVDEKKRSIREFECTYSEYREIRKKEIEDQWKDFGEAQNEQNRLKKSTEQRDTWIKKIEQTRANNRRLDPGEKEKPVAAYLRDKEGRMGKRTKVMKDRVHKAVDTLNELDKPTVRLPINLEFEDIERSGELVFEIKNATYAYDGKKSIGPFNLEVSYGERVHISGVNGSGKTTLVKMLLNEIKETNGEVRVGSRVHIGYLPQEDVLIKVKEHGRENVIDAVCRIVGVVRDDEQEGLLRMTLKRFGFEEDDAKKSMENLSAGERSRLQLALMKLMKANCIILDEPTNHLDIECVEALEKALKEFKGTLIVVSHDRRFCERVGFTREYKI
jgi:ATPase subunit of ABC transporter with duplicated ATPase domains